MTHIPSFGRSARRNPLVQSARASWLLLAALALTIPACGNDDENAETSEEVKLPANASKAVATYSEIVEATYADSLAAAEELDTAVQALIAEPSEDALDDARTAWLAAREPYLQSEVFRFYEGPIDNAEDGPEGLLNAWPLDEQYIDYVEGEETEGVINDPDVEISAEGLEALNEQGGEKNIATGYHAVEFLLWGQDQSEDGPGNRPYTDYVTDGSGTAANQDRRGEYLSVVSGLIVSHLEDLTAAWAPDEDNYRAEFEAEEASEGLRRILTGMITLSGFETGGERLQTAYDTKDQEDEHSCFSDNTHRDMVQDIQGVSNVWKGTYQRLDGTEVTGTGVREVVLALNLDLASELDDRIAKSLSLAQDLQAPFDQEIAADNEEGRARVLALIKSLRTQEELLQEVFRACGLAIPETE